MIPPSPVTLAKATQTNWSAYRVDNGWFYDCYCLDVYLTPTEGSWRFDAEDGPEGRRLVGVFDDSQIVEAIAQEFRAASRRAETCGTCTCRDCGAEYDSYAIEDYKDLVAIRRGEVETRILFNALYDVAALMLYERSRGDSPWLGWRLHHMLNPDEEVLF